jgi:hypothetical protein
VSIGLIAIIVFAFVLAGGVKGTLGIGLPVTALGILSQVLDPRAAVALSILPILVANSTLVARSGGAILVLRQYWVFLLTLALVLLISSSQLNAMPIEVLEAMLGVMILVFALTNLALKIPALPDRLDRPMQVVTGVVGGTFGGLTGLWAPPLFLYLIARRVEKEEFVQTTGLLLLLGSIPLAFGYWRAGMLPPETALMSAAMIVPTLLGFFVGEQIRKRIDASRFRTATLIAFLLIGLNLLREAVF